MSQDTNESVIEARGLSRRFGKLVAVDQMDLEIHRGEVFGFLGPNGAGKSTLIRMLVGLLSPSAGSATVLGFNLPAQAESLRPHIGYMTQRFSLYEDLSVRENLDFAAQVFGIESRERHDRVREVLAEYGLTERRDQRPATLSGGWKQRLALAAATIHRPKLLVLDEPTAGVDPDNRRTFWERIFEIAADGSTILVSTHYMDEAVRCHRLCMMIKGKRAAIGKPSDLQAALKDRIIELWADPVERAIATLNGLEGVASVTQLGNAIHVLLTPEGPNAGEAIPKMLRSLEAAGFQEVRAEPSEPSLEDVFVALLLGEKLGTAAGEAT